MTALERSLRRLRANSPESEFSDVRRVLEAHGWVQRRQRGSHVTFKKPGGENVTIPLTQGNLVKHVYVARMLRRLGLDG